MLQVATVRLKVAEAEELNKKWAEEDEVKIGDDVVTCEVLEGEEEEQFLNKCKVGNIRNYTIFGSLTSFYLTRRRASLTV